MKKKIRLSALFVVVIAVALLIYGKIHDERNFACYTRFFNYVKTGEDTIRVYGTPKGSEYDYNCYQNGERHLVYITLYYDGFSFGILDDDLAGSICKLTVEKPGLLPLRGGIDIGASRAEVERSYSDAPLATEGDAYYLTYKDEISWEGIWIFPVYDENDILVQFDVTDGL